MPFPSLYHLLQPRSSFWRSLVMCSCPKRPQFSASSTQGWYIHENSPEGGSIIICNTCTTSDPIHFQRPSQGGIWFDGTARNHQASTRRPLQVVPPPCHLCQEQRSLHHCQSLQVEQASILPNQSSPNTIHSSPQSWLQGRLSFHGGCPLHILANRADRGRP